MQPGSTPGQLDCSHLPTDWSDALSSRGWDGNRVDTLVEMVYGTSETVYPPHTDVFRAFHLTPLEDVKVVILGQDPYPRPGQAHGLAFSVPSGLRQPPSLRRIFRALSEDDGLNFRQPRSGDLAPWAEKGVLLLNTALTVKEGAAGSHVAEWKAFTDSVVELLAERRTPVVFLLWGTPAHGKGASLATDEPRRLLLCSAHPAARGRTRAVRFGLDRPFSSANDFLTSHGATAVDWSLPSEEGG